MSNPKRLSAILLSILMILACSTTNLPLLSTPTPPVAVVEITVVYRDTATPTATPVPTNTPSPTATILPISDAITSTVTLPSDTSTSPLATPTPEDLVPVVPSTTGDTGPTTGAGSEPSTRPGFGQQPDGTITLLEPAQMVAFPENVGPVDFKWMWNEVDLCETPPDDRGFEVRIWPDLPNFGPLGVADAAATQEDVFCDEKTGTRIFRVGNLRGAPGIQARGSGQFRWEVALIALTEPFTQIAVSESRAFLLPPAPAVPVPTLTPVPQVTLPCPCDEVSGEILLIQMDNGVTVPLADENFEVKWRWTGAPGCELPPPGYGFEVRVWPNRPEFAPMGAMGDATQSQAAIYCDPANGQRSYLVQNYKNAPGIKVAGAGEFRWDVILFKADPYTEVLMSEQRTFILPGESKLDN